MEKFWTSKKPINGLRHFVLVNETKKKGKIIFLFVSVLDVAINLKISHKELISGENWVEGWLNLSKMESITEDYCKFKSVYEEKGINVIFIDENSSFDIS